MLPSCETSHTHVRTDRAWLALVGRVTPHRARAGLGGIAAFLVLACSLGLLNAAEPQPAPAPSTAATKTATNPPAASSPFRRAVEEAQRAAHAHPDRSPAYWSELERGFRRLQAEYPGESEVYAELLFVADHAPGPHAELLERIQAWPAPEETKAKARGIQRKQASLNQPCTLVLPGLAVKPVRVEEARGHVVILDFWATWCPPCREKLPELKQLYAREHGRGLEIIGVSFDEDLAALRRFVAKEGLTWPQAGDGRGWNRSALTRTLGLTSLPTMWLIDRQGRLRDIDARDDLATKVTRLLAE